MIKTKRQFSSCNHQSFQRMILMIFSSNISNRKIVTICLWTINSSFGKQTQTKRIKETQLLIRRSHLTNGNMINSTILIKCNLSINSLRGGIIAQNSAHYTVRSCYLLNFECLKVQSIFTHSLSASSLVRAFQHLSQSWDARLSFLVNLILNNFLWCPYLLLHLYLPLHFC